MSETTSGLAKLRMMGTDVAVEAAVIVGLAIETGDLRRPASTSGATSTAR